MSRRCPDRHNGRTSYIMPQETIDKLRVANIKRCEKLKMKEKKL